MNWFKKNSLYNKSYIMKAFLITIIMIFLENCYTNNDIKYPDKRTDFQSDDYISLSKKTDEQEQKLKDTNKPIITPKNQKQGNKSYIIPQSTIDDIKELKSQYCFKNKKYNNEFINISKGVEEALKEYKYIFREKEQGDGYGNLKKIKMLANKKDWDKIHHIHYDWWMFPSDRDSAGYDMTYSFDERLINELKKDKKYIKDYLEGIKYVLLAWGWDFEKNSPIKNLDTNQKWDGYSVRLLKIIYSTILLEQLDAYNSVCKFIEYIINNFHNGVPYPNTGNWEYINLYTKVN
ncbi:MAG: hypothetical protein GY830_03060 [Bacteroidetes bacterium]|nr:hypothetical protein [Bacteroidota bacterium]